ncbi:hypothetical protein ASG20_00090 [Sphingomonas sp. Leaf198]|nr:hypothetical protein ASG20_00090 [Sphingomonas sp. Leaf198]
MGELSCYKLVIFVRYLSIELAVETAQAQCRKGRGFFFDREDDIEHTSAVSRSHCGKSLGEAARAGKQIYNLEHSNQQSHFS